MGGPRGHGGEQVTPLGWGFFALFCTAVYLVISIAIEAPGCARSFEEEQARKRWERDL